MSNRKDEIASAKLTAKKDSLNSSCVADYNDLEDLVLGNVGNPFTIAKNLVPLRVTKKLYSPRTDN